MEAQDALDTDLNGTDDVVAGAAVAGDITAYYNNASSAMGTETAITGFGTRTDAVQNAAIADALASYETAVATATKNAAEGMTALLTAAESKREAVVAAQEVKLDTATDLTAEIAAFESANSTVTFATNVVFGEDYDPATDNGKIVISNGVAYTGETGVALASLTADASIKRVAALESAYDADVAAAAALASAKESFEAAVEAVVLAETEAYSVYGLGSAVVYTDAAATVTLDYSVADIEVFTTKALADADAAGVKEVFTATFTDNAEAASETWIFDGTTVNVGASATAATIAAAAAQASYANWVAKDNSDGTVTFTAKVAGAVDDTVYTGGVTGTYTEFDDAADNVKDGLK